MIAEHLSTEDKQQALDLVSRSNTFARSERLRGLLQFICQADIEGRHDTLNEYVIGVEALGRPEGYSPSEDSCVRSRVYELRQRLERFYATEAPDAPLRIDLPKGSYIPRYVRAPAPAPPVEIREPAAAAPVKDDPPPAVVPAPAPRPYWPIAAAFIAGALLMYGVSALRGGPASAGLVTRNQPSALWTPELESIWRPFLDRGAPVLVSFQSRLFLSGGSLVIRDPRIDAYPEIETSLPIMRAKELFGVRQLYENRNYTDFGAASACLLLGRLLGGRQPNILAKRSSDVNWDDLGAHNVVVLGKPNADPDIARLLPKEHFVIEGARIRNLKPAASEPAEWTDNGTPWDRSNTWTQKYGLVTLIPGPRPGRWILSLAGSGSEHVWALAQFMTSPDSARQLSGKLRPQSGAFPSSWQAVVRADFKAQSPVKVEYVTHRTL